MIVPLKKNALSTIKLIIMFDTSQCHVRIQKGFAGSIVVNSGDFPAHQASSKREKVAPYRANIFLLE